MRSAYLDKPRDSTECRSLGPRTVGASMPAGQSRLISPRGASARTSAPSASATAHTPATARHAACGEEERGGVEVSRGSHVGSSRERTRASTGPRSVDRTEVCDRIDRGGVRARVPAPSRLPSPGFSRAHPERLFAREATPQRRDGRGAPSRVCLCRCLTIDAIDALSRGVTSHGGEERPTSTRSPMKCLSPARPSRKI